MSDTKDESMKKAGEAADTNAKGDAGKDKKEPECDAFVMTEDDVFQIVKEIRMAAGIAEQNLISFSNGMKYEETLDSMSQLIQAIAGGYYREFAKKNKWLKTNQDKYLSGTTGHQTARDRLALVELYNVATDGLKVLNPVMLYFSQLKNDILPSLYKAKRFEIKMKDAYKEEDIVKIKGAFDEFADLMEKYNRAGIVDEIGYEGADDFNLKYTAVLMHMDESLKTTNYLYSFIASTKQPRAEGYNKLYNIDRDTFLFREYKDIITQKAAPAYQNDMPQFRKDLMDGVASCATDAGGIYQSLAALFAQLIKTVGDVIDAIQRFESDTVPPYSVMTYPGNVVNVASKYLMTNLSDPKEAGTRYTALAQSMLSRFKELAKSVAKAMK